MNAQLLEIIGGDLPSLKKKIETAGAPKVK